MLYDRASRIETVKINPSCGFLYRNIVAAIIGVLTTVGIPLYNGDSSVLRI